MQFASDGPAKASAAQIRAARAMLAWKQDQLADKAGVARRTLATLEAGGDVTETVRVKVQEALERAGVRFIRAGNGSGLLFVPQESGA